MMTKSATALRWVVHQYFLAISVIIEIGHGQFGFRRWILVTVFL
jgi:hypothetical protein